VTLTELVQAVEARLDAVPNLRPSTFGFSTDFVPDAIQHRSFLVIGSGDTIPSSGSIEDDLELEIRVAYLVNQNRGEKTLIQGEVLPDLEAIRLALLDNIDAIGGKRPLSWRIDPTEGGQSMVLTLRVPAHLCQTRP
jgi:hypothetical protein